MWARKAGQQYQGVALGTVGPVESKLFSFGNFGEVSGASHKVLDRMTTSRARVAVPQTAPLAELLLVLRQKKY